MEERPVGIKEQRFGHTWLRKSPGSCRRREDFSSPSEPLWGHLVSHFTAVLLFTSVQVLVFTHTFKNIHKGGIWPQGTQVGVLLLEGMPTDGYLHLPGGVNNVITDV